MKKTQYTSKTGLQLWRPVFDKEAENLVWEGTTGFCLACGEETDGVEPDARRYACPTCNEAKVFGLEELLLRGLLR